ncbi:helix-turn-helix transcriptional regulator [Microbacterium deminutum]|uniref:LuxR family transcriptional regulator n=1 Tax=Microbacterium deminutum TaxID=344164 RepID=A0ABP5CMW4_9MICO
MNSQAERPAAVVGRDEVRERIAAALTGPNGEGAGTVVITGPAGVGKTVLAQDVIRAHPHARAFVGAGLPLSTVSVPFLLFRSMLRATGADGSIDFDEPASRVLVAIDHWIDELASESRVVLVLDDLQWVDPATLDVVLYLMAGSPDRPLSIIATVRDELFSSSRAVDQWISNIRRMPRCTSIALGPLDRAGTEDQIAAVLGTRPHQSLVEDVFAHTRGFPYLTALVVAGLDPQVRRLPDTMPADLVDAVELSTRGLDSDVVTMLRVMALAGRPMTGDQLRELLLAGGAMQDVDSGLMDVRLAEASTAGTITTRDGRTYWFQHPLAAEVLDSQLSDGERAFWHAAFVRVGEHADPDAQGFEDIGRIADHAAASGSPSDAYRWSLIAFRRATESGADAQSLRFVERALSLHAAVPVVSESEEVLLHAVRLAARACAAHQREVDVIDRLLATVDELDVLERAELSARRMILIAALQRGEPEPQQIDALLGLTARHRTSWQHAYALALASMWMPEADRAAAAIAEACECAERSGNDLAIAWSLAAGVDFAMVMKDDETALHLAPRAIAAALRAPDGLAHNVAALAAAVAAFGEDTVGFAETLKQSRLSAVGILPHVHTSWLAIQEARCWFQLGRWKECAAALRFTIGEHTGAIIDMTGRAIAGRLATRQGRFSDADGHFARLAELRAETKNILSDAHLGLAELLIERGALLEAARTLASVNERALNLDRVRFQFTAMRTLADARALRCESPAQEVETLVEALAFAAAPPSGPRWAYPRLSPLGEDALARLHRAEGARAASDSDAAERWIEAADACRAVAWPWEEAYACRRAVEALLLAGRPDRRAAAPVLRRGLEIAVGLGAMPIERVLRDLARYARIPVAVGLPDDAPTSPGNEASIEGLTPRESEIVELVAAGRTYHEIADELFVSEKTVSSHISNILRKTGAANRVELARLASEVRLPTSG